MNPVFNSDDEAAASWAEQNRLLSEMKEHIALIYAVNVKGGTVFYHGRTCAGMGKCGPFRPNVVMPFLYLYLVETVKEWLRVDARPVAMVHSHPRPPEGTNCRHHTYEDRLLVNFPGIHSVFVAPFENSDVNPWPKR